MKSLKYSLADAWNPKSSMSIGDSGCPHEKISVTYKLSVQNVCLECTDAFT